MELEYKDLAKDKDLISMSELSIKLGVHRNTIGTWRRKKGFPTPVGYKALYGAFFKIAEVNEWLKKKPAMDKEGFSKRGRKCKNANGEQK